MKPCLLLTAFIIYCTVARSQSTNNSFSFSSVTESKKKVWPKKNNVLDVYPNPSYSGEISIHSKTDQVLHFYIFDLEGTLIYQIVLKTREKKNISNLNKGTYTYSVFANDESVEEGKLVINKKEIQ